MKNLLSLFSTVSLGMLSTASFAGNARQPNILLIMTDDLGWGDLGCYGAPDTKTPNIDRLADNGMRLTNFHASAPVSSPARAALMTGCFPDLAGVQGVIRYDEKHNFGYLKQGMPTLAECFKEAGYDTCLIGKWHLGYKSPNLPNEKGFDEFKGWLGGSVSHNTVHTLYDRNFMRDNTEPVNTSGVHVTDVFTQWSVDYLRDNRNNDTPFFMFLSYTAPHAPIEPTDKSLRKVLKRERGIDMDRAKYIALIEHVDEGIGKVMETLKETKKLDNTIVIFMSDNGGEIRLSANNGPYRGGKHTMWEGGLKVPFIISWTNAVPSGLCPDNLMTTMDIFPTLLDFVGKESCIPAAINGVSFANLLREGKFADPERTLYFVEREGWKHLGRSYYAVMFDGWKVFQNNCDENFIYVRLSEDEYEQNVLKGDKAPKDVSKKFTELMENHMIETGRVPWQNPE